jgi:hypothetical protein
MQVLVPPAPFITAEDMKAFLQKKVNLDSASEDQLNQILSAACYAIVERAGYVSPATIREKVRFSNGLAVLTARPVLSVLNTDLVLENREGVISGVADGVVTVDYIAGRGNIATETEPGTIPENYTMAAKEMCKHVWDAVTNNQTRPLSGTSDQVIIPQTNWLLPIRVREMIGLGREFRDMPFIATEQVI